MIKKLFYQIIVGYLIGVLLAAPAWGATYYVDYTNGTAKGATACATQTRE